MMHPSKLPGPNGFTAGFHIKHWDLLKNDVCVDIQSFLEGGDMPEVVNSMVLVLKPKFNQRHNLTRYRPIALCSVLYKIAAKVLALRLRSVLEEIIFFKASLSRGIHYLKRRTGKSGVVLSNST
jgi:hypothetical protein